MCPHVSVREEEFGGTISPSQGSDSSDEDSSEVAIAPQEVDDGSDDSSSSSGPAVREDEGKTEEDTDTDEDDEGGADEDEDDKGQQGFTNNGEPEFKPKKVKLGKTCLMFETHLLNTHMHITHSKAHFYTTAVAQESFKT